MRGEKLPNVAFFTTPLGSCPRERKCTRQSIGHSLGGGCNGYLQDLYEYLDARERNDSSAIHSARHAFQRDICVCAASLRVLAARVRLQHSLPTTQAAEQGVTETNSEGTHSVDPSIYAASREQMTERNAPEKPKSWRTDIWGWYWQSFNHTAASSAK